MASTSSVGPTAPVRVPVRVVAPAQAGVPVRVAVPARVGGPVRVVAPVPGRARPRVATISTGVPVVRLAYALRRSSPVVASATTRPRRARRSAWLGSGDLAWLCLDTQVGDGALQEPNAPACRLVVGGVTGLRASETQGMGQGVGIVAGHAQQRERLAGQVELLAVTGHLAAVLPHALCDLQRRPTSGMRWPRIGTVPWDVDDRARAVGPHDVSPLRRWRTAPFGTGGRPNRLARQGGHTHQSGRAGA